MTLDEFRKAIENMPGNARMLSCPPERHSDEYSEIEGIFIGYILPSIWEYPMDKREDISKIYYKDLIDGLTEEEILDPETLDDLIEQVIVV